MICYGNINTGSSNEGPAPMKWSGICLDCNEEIYVTDDNVPFAITAAVVGTAQIPGSWI